MALVTTATQAPNVPVRTLPNRPDMVSVGTMVWLTSELMFFAGLFAMFFTCAPLSPKCGPSTAASWTSY